MSILGEQGLVEKTVHFFGTGAIGVADKLTDVSGKAIGNGTAPKSVANGWTVNAEFNGDALYQGYN